MVAKRKGKDSTSVKTAKSRRPETNGLVGLLSETKIATDRDLAGAFVGRFMTVDEGSLYEMLVEPYAGASGSYDLVNRNMENMYIKYVLHNKWTQSKYFRVLAWLLETKQDINSYSFEKTARTFDDGRLPYGKLADVDMNVFNAIVQND